MFSVNFNLIKEETKISDSPLDLNLYKIFKNNDSGTLGVSDM